MEENENEESEINKVEQEENLKRNESGDQMERQKWDKPREFLLSCIAMSVGLGKKTR